MVSEWCCSYCSRDQLITKDNFSSSVIPLRIGETKYGNVGISVGAIRCVNPNCREVTLTTHLGTIGFNSDAREYEENERIKSWALLPESSAKPQPEYIPFPLREDYLEACLIASKSPKASATLSRRCLQGMIRDFCGISKGKLIDEIRTLRALVEAGTAPKGVELETVEAIDAVRDVGNIGAHMEKDINLIVEVDPGEAQALISLIEMLFKEWYVARHDRQERLAKITAIAADKKAQLAEKKSLAATAKQAIPDDSAKSID